MSEPNEPGASRVLLEDAVKRRLGDRGIGVPIGEVATTTDGVEVAADRIGGPVVIKALVPVGDRGRKGLVRIAQSPREATTAAAEMLGRRVEGHRIARILVEDVAADGDEVFVGFGFDFAQQRPVLLCGPGGSGVEDRGSLHSVGFRLADGPPLHAVDSRLAGVVAAGYEMFRDLRAITVEFNPVRLSGGEATVLDGKIALDPAAETPEDAVPGDPEIADNHSAALFDAADALGGSASIKFFRLDGDIAVITIGGGALALAHDACRRNGLRPSVATDSSPGGNSDEKLALLLDAALQLPTRGVFIGVCTMNVSTMVIAPAVRDALLRNGYGDGHVPLVARIAGEAESEARALLEAVPGLRYFGRASSIEEAVAHLAHQLAARPDADAVATSTAKPER